MAASSELDCSEYTQLTFSWTVKGLKALFDASKGDAKSKATKSPRFGPDGRWQVLLYPNAGSPFTKDNVPASGSDALQGFISLFLSCEPTAEERERAAADGKWVREGSFTFGFELRTVNKTVIVPGKEAKQDQFCSKVANWGWSHYARRELVYYNNSVVKSQDSFVIVCNIKSSPTVPDVPSSPRLDVPKSLLETFGSLLLSDNPAHADVEFILPRRGQDLSNARHIYASRQLLSRVEYFRTMFSSGFAEGVSMTGAGEMSDSTSGMLIDFDDSDDEDNIDDDPVAEWASATSHSVTSSGEQDMEVTAASSNATLPATPTGAGGSANAGSKDVDNGRVKVVVRDVAYNTYLAMLYWIYTDRIVFAPLSSSFTTTASPVIAPKTPAVTSPGTQLASPHTQSFSRQMSSNMLSSSSSSSIDPKATRRQWIAEWQTNNPDRPAPCSAKAMYRLADRLGLDELRERACRHIMRGLGVENIAYEVFSPFAATFDEIRKLQVKYFLENWSQVRSSEGMREVWQQIRNGRHPGFEEVWPVIASNLEFNPKAGSTEDAAMTM
ncbi:uncharacterized protein SCHCODRAFT_02615508 [Schizophyllum commune H4-8]|uniref:uncharacterized protein n=1 Tax=Schizophyllum commune (strain H4-8 / FGSC 9210) TaxID=578458 RepID=UPI00215FC1DC|nr:uncharacterized protein SCHCODRAFT_02615508 [Schizophyllum commune H4-8]KAI5896671.1 hypothetical protein SCHCODRAFT_02615508 [Schizophyllum commune H4-8]